MIRPRQFLKLLAVLLTLSFTGCLGQPKTTGKFSNQDKPKPVEPAK